MGGYLATGDSFESTSAQQTPLLRRLLRFFTMKLLTVLTSTSSREEAEHIATSLVEEGLAACAQISPIESFYIWNDTLQEESEFRIMIKTTVLQYAAVEEKIQALHSYDLPAIYALSVEDAYPPYQRWVEKNSSRGFQDSVQNTTI